MASPRRTRGRSVVDECADLVRMTVEVLAAPLLSFVAGLRRAMSYDATHLRDRVGPCDDAPVGEEGAR